MLLVKVTVGQPVGETEEETVLVILGEDVVVPSASFEVEDT